jgi:alkanesulfonate monooxygenase SsuD/methylene tetrahydromethanopterin reductase-like flavin-dependent oxidoreductase (luciferase family)
VGRNEVVARRWENLMNRVEFGLFVSPRYAELAASEELAEAAEAVGFDYLSLQDHPYVPEFVDTFALLAWLAGRTQRLKLLTNVANLPLRPAPMLAKAGASIDVLSGGRFELGLGGGRAWPQIAALGGPTWTPAQAVAAVEEAVTIMRGLWQPGPPIDHAGAVFSVSGAVPGPFPAHRIPIWFGASGPRMLRLLGRVADGWIAPISTPFDTKPAAQDLIDAGAQQAGRAPSSIRRAIQLVGTIVPDAPPARRPRSGPGGTPIRATTADWVAIIAEFVTQERFDTVNLLLEQPSRQQVALFGTDVIPQVHELLAAAGTDDPYPVSRPEQPERETDG